MRLPSLLLLLVLSAAAAQAGTPHGKPLPEGPDVPLAQALSAFEAHAGTPRRYSGRIAEVCQAKGCWLMLEDAGQVARVMFGKHDFYIPADSRGQVVVHGVLERRELTPEQVEHLSADSARGLRAAPVEYRITADGIEIAS